MKLCDRCPHAVGCGCSYLGTGCFFIRKTAYPDVVTNNAEAMAAMDVDTLAAELLAMVYELFEGGVPSHEEVRDWLLAPYKGGGVL